MPGKRGALLDPRSREYHWVATAIQAVAEASGQKSRWNKRVYFELSGLEGAASPDGGMSVSDATVLHPLRRAYAGEQLTDSDLSQLRDALVTLTHESLHLCHELQNADGAVQLSAAELALEEGLAENWAQQNVHQVIHAMDLAGKHPTLLTQKPVDAYPALQSATTTLVDGVDTLSGRQHEEVVRRLQAAKATERFGVIADLVIEGRYGGTGDRPELRAQLERTLQEKFAPVLTVERDGSLDADAQKQRGSEISALAVAELDQVLTSPHSRSPAQQPQAVEQTWEQQILAWQKEQTQQAAAREPQVGSVEHLQKFLAQGQPHREDSGQVAQLPGTPADPRHLIARRNPGRAVD
ncbi:hypothetical protein ACGFIF_17800 [Kribbella sp. NPDC049174]|uniref:hypothetical protein n=1 Tax=Kribbella sp. NPDC049174 TaxID=3364112 RepID=UPI003721CEEF